MKSYILKLPAVEIINRIKGQEISAEEYMIKLFERIEREERKIHAFITLTKDSALSQARIIDRKIKKNEKLGRLCGIGIAVKDNICTDGVRTTCGSRILENFIPPYDATVIERIKSEDGIVIGKTNMDEFAMGSTTEYSYFGPTFNPWDRERVPGGSSGGSAAAIASHEAGLALGADTGGSIRCPSSFCSTVGLKGTYGLVSRYGLISYGNSLEQIGPITKDVKDCALLFSCISGHDSKDSTSLPYPAKDYTKALVDDVKGLKIGVVKEFFGEGTDEVVVKYVWNSIKKLESLGASYDELSLKFLEYALPTYYIIAMSEASSNLSRYDGLRYGLRVPNKSYDWNTIFSKNRKLGFGLEVKRRIILGTYALSAGYFQAYYLKAQKIRTLIRREFDQIFKNHDVLICPTMPILPFKLGEKIKDPLEMYMCDIDTVPANLTGMPAISIPCGFYHNLPIGLQIIAQIYREDLLFRVAYTFEQN
ncbi:MAG: Asp-tRNA(Asn)/Glu-tRNA(Gln) amidotransferase subunit GatA [Nitrososphaerales archaeon]